MKKTILMAIMLTVGLYASENRCLNHYSKGIYYAKEGLQMKQARATSSTTENIGKKAEYHLIKALSSCKPYTDTTDIKKLLNNVQAQLL